MRTTTFLMVRQIVREPEFGKGTLYLVGPKLWTGAGTYSFDESPEAITRLDEALVYIRDGVIRLNGHRIAESYGTRRLRFMDQEEITAALDDPQTIRIVKTPGVCGGRACFAGTRMPIWILIQMQRTGFSRRAIAESFPHMTVAHFTAAEQYAGTHSMEIGNDIAENMEDNDG